jgi:hypothetical protein
LGVDFERKDCDGSVIRDELTIVCTFVCDGFVYYLNLLRVLDCCKGIAPVSV